MKILLIGSAVLIACKAGFGLLTAGCLAALLLTRIGARSIRNGNISGENKIVIGVGVALAALFATLVKLAFLFLVWTSLTKIFPPIQTLIESLWNRLNV